MLRVFLLTLMVGAISADPLRGNIPWNHQQEEVQTEEPAQSCADQKECSVSQLGIVFCKGPGITAIPAECPATIRAIICSETSVPDIPDGAFINYSNLTYISIQLNTLQNINKGAFRGLPNLITLLLSSNELSDTSLGIEPFEGLSSLTMLYLNSNKLTTFPLHLFMKAQGLEELHISHNQINDMEPELNFPLNNLTNIDLSWNQIRYLNASMLHQMPNIEKLELHTNNISVIHDGSAFLDIPSLQQLSLSNNPFHCDCQASWILEAWGDNKTWAQVWGKYIPECGSPKWMERKDITQLYPQDLTCETPVITPITSTNISHTTNTPLILQATMERGFPYSTWVAPDGNTENDGDRKLPGAKLDIEYGSVTDEIMTNHSVVTTLHIDAKYFDKEDKVNFTLIASNAAGDSNNLTFWVTTEPAPGGTAAGTPVYTGTLLIMLIYTMVITE